MQHRISSFYKKHLHHYMLFLLIAVVAYLPVSSMTFSLKNDIVALEFPIKYFISECLHNGVQPFWFNTWAMGFPLQSILTWSIFSPPQFLFSLLFRYNLYTLHAEFIFYIALSGCSLYYFLKKHVTKDLTFAGLIACCYMLNGFITGSSQWLLYITAAAFLPLVICFLADLLKNPGWKTAIPFSVMYYTQLTSVYVAFTIVVTYIIIGAVLFYLVWDRVKYETNFLKKRLVYLGIAATFTALLSLPALYGSLELIPHLDRGTAITSNAYFFNSNYLHPKGLITLLLPFSSVKMSAVNTEATMLYSYVGLLPIILFPVCMAATVKKGNKINLLLLALSLFFLGVAFGNTTPLRNWLNVFPGFSYFRNAALFRFFAIFFFLIFIVRSNRDQPFITHFLVERKKIIGATFLFLFALCLTTIFLYKNSLPEIVSSPALFTKAYLQAINPDHTIVISGVLQLCVLLLLAFCFFKKKIQLFKWVIAGELVLNTLLCTPYFTVSSYRVQEVATLFQATAHFPIQQTNISAVRTTYEIGAARWFNINVYRKEVAVKDSYWGPLLLKNFVPQEDSINKDRYHSRILFFADTVNISQGLHVDVQKPDYVVASISTPSSAQIKFQQNWYPGWKAYFNNKPIDIEKDEPGMMQVVVPQSGTLQFRYERMPLFIAALLVHVTVILACSFFLFKKIKGRIKSSFLS